jgi:hypothetical protein
MTDRCADCAWFRNEPEFVEAAFPGLTALSSGAGSTRSSDGICLRHDRYLRADYGCADFRQRRAAHPADHKL